MAVEPIPILEVLEHYGAQLPYLERGGWQKMRCPFHEDRDASASVKTEPPGFFKCHVCDISGDSYKIIMEREGLDFAGALRFAEEVFNRSLRTVRKRGRPRRALLDGARDIEGQGSIFQARVRRKPLSGA